MAPFFVVSIALLQLLHSLLSKNYEIGEFVASL